MRRKTEQKEIALNLRKRGYSYSEILKVVKVSRSSLSEWLRHVEISNTQIEKLRSKNAKARSLGSIALKDIRIKKTKQIFDKSISEIKHLGKEHLKVIGAVLYWAEGSKQNENKPSKELIFTNSDPRMIKVYLLWLQICLFIKNEDVVFEIYIHETYNKTKEDLIRYWSEVSNFPTDNFKKIYVKKNKVNSFRKNRGKEYSGVLRITVKRSTDLNRKVTGWIHGICNQF